MLQFTAFCMLMTGKSVLGELDKGTCKKKTYILSWTGGGGSNPRQIKSAIYFFIKKKREVLKRKTYYVTYYVTTLWPCYSGKFQKMPFQFSSFNCPWIFTGGIFDFLLMQFSVSEFASFKNNVRCSCVKNLHTIPIVLLTGRGGGGQDLSGMSSFSFWRAP